MAQMQITIMALGHDDASAQVEYLMDGLFAGIDWVPALSLAVLTGCWDEPSLLVGRVFFRDVD